MFTKAKTDISIDDNSQGLSDFTPKFAIVTYSSNCDYLDTTIIVKHQISENGFDQGQLINVDELLSSFSGLKKPNEVKKDKNLFLEDHILCNNYENLIFFEKSHTRYPIWVSYQAKPECFHVKIPAMLYVVNKIKKSLSVFALEHDQRPQLSDMLYAAPFPNVSSNGLVCQGSARLPATTEIFNTDEISTSFLYAKKTHLNSDSIFKDGVTTNSTYRKYIKRKVTSSEDIDVANELAKVFTLSDLIKGL